MSSSADAMVWSADSIVRLAKTALMGDIQSNVEGHRVAPMCVKPGENHPDRGTIGHQAHPRLPDVHTWPETTVPRTSGSQTNPDVFNGACMCDWQGVTHMYDPAVRRRAAGKAANTIKKGGCSL